MSPHKLLLLVQPECLENCEQGKSSHKTLSHTMWGSEVLLLGFIEEENCCHLLTLKQNQGTIEVQKVYFWGYKHVY